MLELVLFLVQIVPARPYPYQCVTPPTYGDHTINVLPTGTETYNITGPAGFPGPAPLLVLFHHYNGAHDSYQSALWDMYDLRDRAVARGWYVVMHDGGVTPCAAGNHSTYGNESFQRHTEAVIQNVICRFDIDKNQVYGYGFSMGGGQALSYAARHRNPASNHGFFAAVVNHSGYLPINQDMSAGQPQNNCDQIPDCMYGASYCADPFAWRRADVLDLEPIDCPGSTWGGNPWPADLAEVNYWTSQIHNLARTPIKTYRAIGETSDCMIPGNNLWQAFIASVYGAQPDISQFLLDCSSIPSCPSVAADCMGVLGAHGWDAVCAEDALDWLEGYTRDGVMLNVSTHTNVTLIAEDDVRFYHFTVERTDPADFGRVIWFTPNPNAMGFLPPNQAFGVGPHNLDRLTVLADTQWSLLDPTDTVDPLEIHTTYAVVNQVRGYVNAPFAVYENGVLQTQGTDWTHNATTKIVEFASGAANATWKIVP